MKFGEHLRNNRLPEWVNYYIDYDKLKKTIKELEQKHLEVNAATDTSGPYGTSLSVPRPTNAAGMPIQLTDSETSQEKFYEVIETEMRKIEQFTKKQVKEIRRCLKEVDEQVQTIGSKITDPQNEGIANSLRERVEQVGEDFLKLEKYVNLNVTGFHKILKKHDRRLPNPCKAFYVSRLHNQSWVRGDYSDVIVTMSRVYSAIRGDVVVGGKESERQDFVRSTRKYWVHTEDISRVKTIILQHLPVFMQKSMGEQDSQLVNSVYLDNYSMELYHGRLDKSPGAIALRMRWYGTGEPETVFVERKTHRESWTGDVSMKERFVVKEAQVSSLIKGDYDIDAEVRKLVEKGKSDTEVAEWSQLATEVKQAINSKQLLPTLRTQYMRTAFQIPFDATVRISLDTNLCMINERTNEVTAGMRWYRDPAVSVPLNEITRFPHAVLEVKLQLQGEDATPPWVTELIQSGMLSEVHKFSKFIHGCAVLLPEEVREVPYWVDDPTLSHSIEASGAQALLATSKGANEFYTHLLPHDKEGQSKAKKIAALSTTIRPTIKPPDLGNRLVLHDEDCVATWCEWAGEADIGHVTTQKEEPKVFLANERTFIKWLQMAVMMSSIACAVLAFSHHESRSAGFAMLMLPVSLGFIAYALSTFLWRSEKIKIRFEGRWDDPVGPVILTIALIIALTVQFCLSILNMIYDNAEQVSK